MPTYFYPRSPRGERPGQAVHRQLQGADFYPRSPRGERLVSSPFTLTTDIFLSTLPARGATLCSESCLLLTDISIHAPREGSDPPFSSPTTITLHFYPRSPRGERRYMRKISIVNRNNFYPRSPRGERQPNGDAVSSTLRFLSTLPARGATAQGLTLETWPKISIHAPREGSDRRLVLCVPHPFEISIHAPREGSDCNQRQPDRADRDFYPRSPRGERLEQRKKDSIERHFYPRSPRGERRNQYACH